MGIITVLVLVVKDLDIFCISESVISLRSESNRREFRFLFSSDDTVLGR